MATESDQLDYSDPDESPRVGGPSEQSYIKYHVTITNLSLEGRSLQELIQGVTQQLQANVGPVQSKYVHGTRVGPKVNLLVGFVRDEDAIKLVKGQVRTGLEGELQVTPTEVFACYMEWLERHRPAAAASVQRKRSRSPRTDVPVFYLLFLPSKFHKDEIIQGLVQVGVTEVPKVDQVFTSWKNLGGIVVKLTFKSQEVIDLLCSSDLQVRKKPVLLLQSGPKSSIESILRSATDTYQLLADPGSQSISLDKVTEAAQRFGTVANVAELRGKFLVTYCRGFSAKEALESGGWQVSGGNLTLLPGTQIQK